MKKTVFLFVFLCSLFVSSSVGASDLSSIYDFEEYEIRLSEKQHSSSGRGYRITKLGTNPFEVNVLYLNKDVSITNVVEVNGNHVFYGYIHDYDGETFYDPFVLVLDEYGVEQFTFIDDLGELEEVVEVVEVDHVMIVRIEQSYENHERDLVLDQNIFLTYDKEYRKLNQYTMDEEIKRSKVTDRLYLYDLDYQPGYTGALTADLEVVLDDILDIPKNQVFLDTITIHFVNEAKLNGEMVYNGVYIDYPGNYELEYNDFTYDFIVDPIITGVEDATVYKESVRIQISSGKAFLNNDLYVSDTQISKPGNYTLRITGINNYEKIITFTISSVVSGVLNDQTYDDDVQLEFEGEGYLNNTYIESPYTVTEEGEYLLKIKGEGNYLDTYYFNLDKPEEEKDIIEIVKTYDIVVLGVAVLIGGFLLKKK